jgi:molybdate transport system regulatory protein
VADLVRAGVHDVAGLAVARFDDRVRERSPHSVAHGTDDAADSRSRRNRRERIATPTINSSTRNDRLMLTAMMRLSIRLNFEGARRHGPRKVALFEATGSITGAAKALGMSYRCAWLLLEETNTLFSEASASTTQGGRHGGGAHLTPFGREVVARYRVTERQLRRIAEADLSCFEGHKRPQPTRAPGMRTAGKGRSSR